LAEHIFYWRVSPNRFLTGNRCWLPRWKFQPTTKLNDALRVLEGLEPQEFSISADRKDGYCAKVTIADRVIYGRDKSKPMAICRAVAAVLGIDVVLVAHVGAKR
jgi:hypothetical protein